MYNAIFVDDEPLAHIIFKKQVAKEQRLNIKKTFTSSLEALEYLKAKENQKIDMIFTDIEMPEMNGLKFAEEAQNIIPKAETVFITAYDKYALDAFKVYAFAYLLKPVRYENIKELVDKFEVRKLNVASKKTGRS